MTGTLASLRESQAPGATVACIIAGMKASDITDNLLETTQSWSQSFVDSLPNLIAALLLVGLFGLIAGLVGRGVSSALRRITRNVPISGLMGTIAKLVTWIVGGYLALRILNLDKTVTTLLAGVGVVGLALGFAFQDIAANFMSGVILALRRPFDVGDLVETAGIRGRVQGIDLRATIMETLDGLSIIIPNKEVFQKPIINYTKTSLRRADVKVGVAYDTDLAHARDLVVEALQGVPHRLESRRPEAFFEEFGSSSINLVGRVWLKDSSQLSHLQAVSEGVIGIKAAFDEAGIVIPFPIRTLDFGAHQIGGTVLREALSADDAAPLATLPEPR